MTNKQLLDLLGEMGDRHVLSLDHAPKVRKRRPIRAALIAACVCAAVVGTAFTYYMLSAKAAMEQVYTMGMFYQQDGVRHELGEDFLDLLENEYTTEVDQTAQGEHMDVTLVNVVAFECGTSHVIGYLVRFTLPDGVTIEDGEKYYFDGSYHNQVDFDLVESGGSFEGNYQNMTLISTGAKNTWYGFLVQEFVGESMSGTAVLELSDFCTTQMMQLDGSEDEVECRDPLVMGHWRFEIPLNYKEGIELVNEPVSIIDSQTQVYDLSISPIGIEIHTVRSETFSIYHERQHGEAWGGWMTDQKAFKIWFDKMSDVYLILADGERVKLRPSGQATTDDDAGIIESKLLYSFATPTDLARVSAVEVSGTQFPLS